MKKKSLLILGLVGVLTTITACNKPTKTDMGDYTYNTYLTTNPKTWNVHNWSTNDESYINTFTEMGLYDVVMNETKNGYNIVPEMAAELPKSIDTSEVTPEQRDKYYNGGNPVDNAVWEIKLNQAAKFEDGTVINADTYVESLKRLLDPQYANFRADSFYASSIVVANAEGYFKQGRDTIEAAFSYINANNGSLKDNAGEDGNWYINLGRETSYVGNVFSDYDSLDTDNRNLYTVINNRSAKSDDATELAGQRVQDAVTGFLLAHFQAKDDYYTQHQSFYDNKLSDWNNATSQDSVSKEMLLNHPDIDIRSFDEFQVKVRTQLDNASIETGNEEVYSSTSLKNDLRTFVNGISRGSRVDWAWELPLFVSVYNDNTVNWDNVGLEKVDDYTIRFYLTKPIDLLNFEFAMSSNWIVKTDLYDKLTTSTGEKTKATSYATNSISNYVAYGPYKLASYESGKTINLVKNENWYGWNDGKHVGQYQMTSLNTQIITDHNTAVTEFMKGNLDDLEMDVNDNATYGNSSRRQTTYESYTTKISFNTDRNKLLERQGSSSNKTVLANFNFRKGLSLAINRNDYAATSTAGSKGFTGLLNDLYLYDANTGVSYRSTKQGQTVYNAVYGKLGGNPYKEDGTLDPDFTPTSLPAASNGYNFNMATKFVVDGFKEEFESTQDGHLTKDSKIEIEFRVYDDSSDTTIRANNYLNKAFKDVVNAANAKLGSNVSIDIKLVKDQNYYDTAKNGGYDMIFSTWGGASINPYGLMQVYCDATFDSNTEYGFKGKQDKVNLWIDLNGDGKGEQGTDSADASENKSFNAWYTEMESMTTEQNGEKRLTILAGLEAGIINRFEAIPLVARGSSTLTSFKVDNYSENYVSLVGYGGIRLLKFNYTNAQWSDFVKENSGQLSDLYKTN